MSRPKKENQEDLLSHNLIVRVTESLFLKLEKLRVESASLSIADVCRKILTNRKIKIFQQDVSMHPVMEQLAMIRKELKAIGININQITRSFNQDRTGTHREFHLKKVLAQYQIVDERVETLLAMISKLAEKWLQE